MGTHMKTTVEIPDALYARARRLAAAKGVPFRQVLEELLRDYVHNDKVAKPTPFKIERPSVRRPRPAAGHSRRRLGANSLPHLRRPRRLIAVDTNILVYAHRTDSPWYQRADATFTELAQASLPFAIPWPCVHEFLTVVTHPRVYESPTPRELAVAEVEGWMQASTLVLLGEDSNYWPAFRELILGGRIVGSVVHDARIAALCISHGMRELWTADRVSLAFPASKSAIRWCRRRAGCSIDESRVPPSTRANAFPRTSPEQRAGALWILFAAWRTARLHQTSAPSQKN